MREPAAPGAAAPECSDEPGCGEAGHQPPCPLAPQEARRFYETVTSTLDALCDDAAAGNEGAAEDARAAILNLAATRVAAAASSLQDPPADLVERCDVLRAALVRIDKVTRDRRRDPRLALDAISGIAHRTVHRIGEELPPAGSGAAPSAGQGDAAPRLVPEAPQQSETTPPPRGAQEGGTSSAGSPGATARAGNALAPLERRLAERAAEVEELRARLGANSDRRVLATTAKRCPWCGSERISAGTGPLAGETLCDDCHMAWRVTIRSARAAAPVSAPPPLLQAIEQIAMLHAEIAHWKCASANRDESIRMIEEARDRYAGEAARLVAQADRDNATVRRLNAQRNALQTEAADNMARVHRLTDALEEIASGRGCQSGYGGCDGACKEIAHKALKETT